MAFEMRQGCQFLLAPLVVAVALVGVAVAMVTTRPSPAVGQAGVLEYEVYHQTKDWDKRLFVCSRVIGDTILPPDIRAKAYSSRGDAYLMKKEPDRAIGDYTEAIRLTPKNAEFYRARGTAYAYPTKPDYDRANADSAEAIRPDPNRADAHQSRGIMYFNKRDYDRAIVDLSEALRLDPKNEWSYRIRGDAYEAKGDYERATAD